MIAEAISNFEREKLRYPFGFKGGYLTELWQVATQIKDTKGNTGLGLSTQSVLYGDADIFASNSEAGGNALMYVLANKALGKLEGRTFESPIVAIDKILPGIYNEAKQLTGHSDLNINFVYNALVSIDNALWMLFAKQNGLSSLKDVLPFPYREALSFRNDKVAVMYQVSYGMSLSSIRKAAEDGYFVFKIKTGQPGTEEEMLQKDKERLLEIHEVLKNVETDQTSTGKLYYTMDANGRYTLKSSIESYIDFARKIGAFDHILLYEEPLSEENQESVRDLGLIIAADESIHSAADAERKIKLGYGAFALKPIAKTLSETLKIVEIAHKYSIPCFCADLTVNPILVDWNKHIAASLAPFPKLGMAMMETNGDMNYENWEEMRTRHPFSGASWTLVKQGRFELDEHFYEVSGGMFTASLYYTKLATGSH
ncbi:mandelate racemase/muconate lactonizing enzyme family protein [Echinicola shivajiensis]|uniref:mandelate racemase/muconate lactonizing enzyme family protein n=1 Tax=Echinicola shivajiensis TaxID=1035916 RepID=UPI001BFC6CC9|nr:mandelate racemase/muconate lactonizing enzyme family protein [Echinicola shivajiensis]